MDLKTIVKTRMWEMLHSGISVSDFADSICKSSNYVYRICSPSEDLPTPLEIVIKLMAFTKSYKLLADIAAYCGFTLVRVPRVPTKKADENTLVAEYQHSTTEAANLVTKYFKDPTPESYDKVVNALQAVMADSVAMRKVVDKKQSGQFELPL